MHLLVNDSHLYVHRIRLNYINYSVAQLYPPYVIWSYHLYYTVTSENNSHIGHFQICKHGP